MSSPDPVSDPQAYQQHLLALVGDDDPVVSAGRHTRPPSVR